MNEKLIGIAFDERSRVHCIYPDVIILNSQGREAREHNIVMPGAHEDRTYQYFGIKKESKNILLYFNNSSKFILSSMNAQPLK